MADEKKHGIDVADTIRVKQGTTVDSETLLKNTQMRMWATLKSQQQYPSTLEPSYNFLRQNAFSRINAVILYVDLVGSTKLAMELPGRKLAEIVSAFTQEMASLVMAYKGMVLKYMGDAVIGYFVAANNSLLAADKAVDCAKSMVYIVREGINPVLDQYYYPEMRVKIGIDYGESVVVKYGDGKHNFQLDLMGTPLNMASKIQAMAKPDQILIGERIYSRLHPVTQKQFELVIWKDSVWKYYSLESGNIYDVYAYMPPKDDSAHRN